MTADDVADCIEKFIDGLGGRHDWDDFISVPIADDALDAIRRRCAELPKLRACNKTFNN
jgi:hypothetical protein